MLLNLAFELSQLKKKVDKRDVKGASILRGTQTVVEGSILVLMMARRVCFATVRSEFFSICFKLAVRRLRGLCWVSVVCGTLLS